VPPPPGRPGAASDYHGKVAIEYAPRNDGQPDPGEVVWTWVPFEEDGAHGKDRPVVVVGHTAADPDGDGDTRLAVLMLSSKDHGDDPRWMLLGAGGWDPEGRPSSVRLDRVMAVAPDAVRREGAALDRRRFDLVATALRADQAGDEGRSRPV
jgi:hypothetical protein